MNKQKLLITLDTVGYSLFGHRIRNSQLLKSLFSTEDYKMKLRQANMSVPYYMFIPRIILISLFISLLGVIIGLVIGLYLSPQLSQLSVGLTVYSPIAIAILDVLKDNIIFIVAPLSSLIGGFFVFSASYITLGYYPTYISNEREREIDRNLAHISSMMYAGAGGSSNTLKAFRKVADSDDLYGETAIESQKLINKIDNSNKDLKTAIKELKKETSSEDLNRFLADLENKIDEGSSKTQYFNQKTREYQDELFQKRKLFSDTLSSSIGGLLFVVLGLVIANIGFYFQSFAGSGGVLYLSVLNYGIIPIFALITAVIINMFIQNTVYSKAKLQTEYNTTEINLHIKSLLQTVETEKDYVNYSKNVYALSTLLYKLDQIRNNFIKILIEKPQYTILGSIPISIVLLSLSVLLGFVSPTIDAFIQAPITQTLLFIGIPLYVILTPIVVLYEYDAYKKSELEDEYKSFLRKAEANNKVNKTLVETIQTTAKEGENALSNEMEKAYNKISWTGQINRPLTEFANDLKIPKVSRSVKLLKMANEISGQIEKVLDVSERDVDNMISIKDAQKRQTIGSITMVVFLFVIYIGISIAVEQTFITQITEELQSLPDSAGASMPIPISGGSDMNAPIKLFSLLYYHQSITFGVSIGPIIGLIRNNNAMAGLKYSLAFFTLTTIAYASKYLIF